MLAPPLSTQLLPSKLPGVCPGARVYQWVSPAYRNGCVNAASTHCEGSVMGFSVVDCLAACAGTATHSIDAQSAATAMPKNRGGRTMYGISGPPCPCHGDRDGWGESA